MAMFAAIDVLILATPSFAHAQVATTTQGYVARATVLQVVSDTVEDPTATPTSWDEVVTAQISQGSDQGKLIEFSNDYVDGDGEKLNPGEAIFVTRYQEAGDGDPIVMYSYSSLDHDRLPTVAVCTIIFLGCLAYFGGKQGIRGLVSLLGGVSLIIFMLLPGILEGYSPVLLSIIVASFVATLGAYITHGFSKMTTAAIIGMILTILGVTVFAQLAVHMGYLSGVTDESSYDLLTTPSAGVSINFQGLLLGGIIIGMLGILYDAAIGQAVAVEELARVGPDLSRSVIYQRAYRIGREHIGALVNTLVLAYVGASLPVMIILFQSDVGNNGYMPPVFNWGFVATEIIRTTVGASGLILTIPVTTAVAVWMLVPKRPDPSSLVSGDESDEPYRPYGFSLKSLKAYMRR